MENLRPFLQMKLDPPLVHPEHFNFDYGPVRLLALAHPASDQWKRQHVNIRPSCFIINK
jgi:hypothetical protein